MTSHELDYEQYYEYRLVHSLHGLIALLLLDFDPADIHIYTLIVGHMTSLELFQALCLAQKSV